MDRAALVEAALEAAETAYQAAEHIEVNKERCKWLVGRAAHGGIPLGIAHHPAQQTAGMEPLAVSRAGPQRHMGPVDWEDPLQDGGTCCVRRRLVMASVDRMAVVQPSGASESRRVAGKGAGGFICVWLRKGGQQLARRMEDRVMRRVKMAAQRGGGERRGKREEEGNDMTTWTRSLWPRERI